MIAGPVVVGIGYLRAPAASACATVNSIDLDLGKPATCSTTPSLLWFAAGAVLFVAGLLLAMTRRRRTAGHAEYHVAPTPRGD